MPTFKDRFQKLQIGLSDFVGGEPRRNEMTRMIELMNEARRGSYIMTPDLLQRSLKEMDSRLINMILRQYGFEMLGGSTGWEHSEQDRRRAVDESRYMYFKSPLIKRATQLWTDFGFGNAIAIKAVDETANSYVQEFMTAKRNAPLLKLRRLHLLSEILLRDGEYFFICFSSRSTGVTTLRKLGTKQIESIICVDEDKDLPLFYKRSMSEGSLYYPAWSASPDDLDNAWTKIKANDNQARRADEEKNGVLDSIGTDVKTLHVAYNLGTDGRGWPQFCTSFPWARTYESFIGDIAGRARAVAMFVDEIIHEGGSRVQDAIEAKFQSTIPTYGYERNPMPPAGSPMVHNKNVTVDRRPFSTGAADAQKDKFAILSLFSADSGIGPHWLGNPDAMQNRSVAEETSLPFKQQTQRYQLFWSDIFEDLINIVLTAYEDFGKKSFPNKKIEVGINAPVTVNAQDIQTLINAVKTAFDSGDLDTELSEFAFTQLVRVAIGLAGLRPSEQVEQEQEQEEESEPGFVQEHLQKLSAKLVKGEINLDQYYDMVLGLHNDNSAFVAEYVKQVTNDPSE